MLKTNNLSFSFDQKRVFHFPDLSLKKGEQLLISGKSGSGKTTLLHLLALLQKPQFGEIYFNNEIVSQLQGKNLIHFRATHFGVVFQKNYFLKSLNVMDNLKMSLYYKNQHLSGAEIRKTAEQLDVENLLQKNTYQLSGGEQQRISILRALLHKPAIILADEPTASLDDENAQKVAQLLQFQSNEYGASLVIVSHDFRLKSIFDQQINL